MTQKLFDDVELGEVFEYSRPDWVDDTYYRIEGDSLDPDLFNCDCDDFNYNAESLEGLSVGHICYDEVVTVR